MRCSRTCWRDPRASSWKRRPRCVKTTARWRRSTTRRRNSSGSSSPGEEESWFSFDLKKALFRAMQMLNMHRHNKHLHSNTFTIGNCPLGGTNSGCSHSFQCGTHSVRKFVPAWGSNPQDGENDNHQAIGAGIKVQPKLNFSRWNCCARPSVTDYSPRISDLTRTPT